MILNKRAYRNTKAKAKLLRAAIKNGKAAKRREGVDPKLQKANIDGMRAQLKDMAADLKAFGRLKSAAGKSHLEESIAQFGLLMIQVRIARGLMQKQLAARLGWSTQRIQDYESTGYSRTNVTLIREALAALGAEVTLKVRLIPIPAPKKAVPPAGAKQPHKGRRKA
ncbi:MAG: helix-turn-helix transcriptional regulator [Vicinamibacterales bacterium]